MTSTAYPNARPVTVIAQRMRDATADAVHEFWPDELSVLDANHVDLARVHGARQLTDVYLLALAVQRGGRLVTFDRSIAIAAVHAATPAHLVVL